MQRLRIIVTGMVGQIPVGGVAWDYLQYAVGLHQLGHDVIYHEDTWSWPYHPIQQQNVDDPTYSAQFISDYFARYCPALNTKWHYLHLHEKSCGMSRESFDEFARSADIFINVSGACQVPESLSPHCIKVFLDTDPGYNQIMLTERFSWSENVDRWCATVAGHDRHFTYAENIHSPDCLVPHAGLAWQTTRMPIPLSLWRDAASRQAPSNAPWTTVMTWNAFKGKLIHKGVEYGSKGAEFEKLLNLPTTLKARNINVGMTVAVGGKAAPLERVASHGWNVVDGPGASLTPELYEQFIVNSRGEISPAKHVYVATRSGWFSCRTACYLAAGRPVVVQDTGFAKYYPTGAGLLTFDTPEQAVEGIARVEADYAHHAKAALRVAHEALDSSNILRKFVDDIVRPVVHSGTKSSGRV